MAKTNRKAKKKISKRKKIVSGIVIALFLIVASALFYINSNFNTLISSKIYTLYNQSEASNYYNLHFDKLRVNLVNMSIRVYGVHFYPRKEDHPNFFQENGSLEVEIGKIVLKDADVIDFLSSNNISIDAFKVKNTKISIYKTSENFHPFAFIKKENKNDSLQISIQIADININKAELIYYRNTKYNTKNSFDNFNLEVAQLSLVKNESFNFSFNKLMASLNDISYQGDKGIYVSMKQFQFGVSNFQSQSDKGKFDFSFNDLFFQLSKPKLVTTDSVYTISAEKVLIDKSRKRMTISNANLHPNLSKEAFTNRFKFQKLRPELSIQNIQLTNIDFSRLVNNKGIFADSLIISSGQANLFKSKLKPLNKQKFPQYLALQINSIKYPLHIGVVTAKQVDIDFTLEQKNGQLSHVEINKLQGKLLNVQNQTSKQKLHLIAKGNLENSIPFSANLAFSYTQDRFSYSVEVYKSNLRSISKMIHSFAPVTIKSGNIERIKVRGIATRTDSRGEMTFVYNDLNIQIDQEEENIKKKIGSHILSFAANTYILSNNPTDANLPPRKVHFIALRNMNKGFINLLIQSIMSGVKETVLPSRDNRQRYKQVKKDTKQ
jgi:hypothetical protein